MSSVPPARAPELVHVGRGRGRRRPRSCAARAGRATRTHSAASSSTEWTIDILWAVLVPASLAAGTVGALLLVRRRAPDEGFFRDGDRAAGVFGVLATGFSVLLGFVVFLAFTSFDQSRAGAESEALTVAQQFEIAQFLPEGAVAPLGAELICYGRYVVGTEWPRMEADVPAQVNPWGLRLFQTLRDVEPSAPSQEAAYSKWLDETADREEARRDRLHGAEGIIPWPLWAALVLVAVVIAGYMLFFADPGESRSVQAVQVGSVTIVIVTMLMLVRFLDHPFREGSGGLQPTAMQRTLALLEDELAGVGDRIPPPCDREGAPR
jgi:hypothetical protein